MEIPEKLMRSIGTEPIASATTLTETRNELLELKADTLNQAPGSLGEIDCHICKNKGYVAVADSAHETVVTKRCECMTRRENLRRLRKSGLMDMLKQYTFAAYKADEPWQRQIKDKALDYVQNGYGKWFVIAGTPGSGKTHICTAICGALIDGGKSVRYMLWRSEAPRLKALVNDREAYERTMAAYRHADVLYIDDFFKGTVSDADINLAFELLNDRYNARKTMTIISGEKTIELLLGIDEAVGSRIYERSKGYCIKTPDRKNQRLKGEVRK